MPLLDIEIVLRPNETLPGSLAADLADRAGVIFSSVPGETWVKVRTILAEHYAENGGPLLEGLYPVFVSVLKARRQPVAAMQAEVSELTTSIAHACARPVENVHIFYQPEGKGRVAFGGRLVLE